MAASTPLTNRFEVDQPGVQYLFSTAAPDQPAWELRAFRMNEAISQVYSAVLDLACESPSANAAAMLGRHATVRMRRDEEHAVHGIVVGVEALPASAPGTARIRVRMAPALLALSLRSGSRIFSDARAPDIALEVLHGALGAFGRTARLDFARDDYPRLEYTVQHRETDLTFVRRLLAEHGLYFYFSQPTEDGAVEEVVITDAPDCAPAIAGGHELELLAQHDAPAMAEAVDGFSRVSALATSAVHLRQFDWTHPMLASEARAQTDESGDELELSVFGHGDIADFDYQRPRYRQHDAERQATLRLEAARSGTLVRRGTSNASSLRAGHFAKIGDHEYLITRVSHEGGRAREDGRSNDRGWYRNRFECVPRALPYRTARLPRPRIEGPQTAVVVDARGNTATPRTGGDGDDVCSDEHGRIRVKFHWDPSPVRGGTSSAWLRVGQTWAGQHWGAQFLPRVGMEVLVQFIEGDPDRPLVMGALYNGLNAAPFAEDPKESGVKTCSSVDARGYNAWSFVDTAQNEQIRTRAQRNYVETVMRNHTTTVHGAQSQRVQGSQSESIGANAALSAHSRNKNVGGDEAQAIAGTRNVAVAQANTVLHEDTHTVEVMAALNQTYLGAHQRTVVDTQRLEANADKLEHVCGRFELTTDTASVLRQGKTTRTFRAEQLTLDCAGALSLVRGPATASSDTSDNIVLKTPGTLSFAVGGSKLVISASGVEISAAKITLTVQSSTVALTPASAKISSVNTTVEASAVCQVRGAAMLALN